MVINANDGHHEEHGHHTGGAIANDGDHPRVSA